MPLDLAQLTRRLASSYQPSEPQPYSLEASFQTVLEAEKRIYAICERAGIKLPEDALPLRENTLPLREERYTSAQFWNLMEKGKQLSLHLVRGAVGYTAGGYALEASSGNHALAIATTAIVTLGICAAEELGQRAISNLLPPSHQNV